MTATTTFRFHLTTLLLFVFSIGTATLIWLRREPWAIEFSYDEKINTSEDNRWLIFRSESGYEIRNLISQERRRLPFGITKLRISISSQYDRITTVDNEFTVRLWNLNSLQQVGSFKVEPAEKLYAWPVLPSSVKVWSKSGWSLWLIADDGTGRELHKSRLTNVFSSENGRYEFDEFAVWSTETGEKLPLPARPIELLSHGNGRYSNKLLLFDENRRTFVFDLAEGKAYPPLEPVAPRSGWERYQLQEPYLRFNTEDPPDSHVSAWDYKTGKLVNASMLPPNDEYMYSNDRRRYFADRSIIEATTGTTLFKFPKHRDEYAGYTALFTPDRELVLIDDAGLEVWSRRHPEWWWGHFYRPEVWLGLLLSAVWLRKLFHSLRRRNS